MTIPKSWPEHQNPDPSRTASAPYNFVPLPEKVIPVVKDAEDLPSHDKYYPELRSGYFDVTLTTRSPLYIRGPVSAKDFPRQEKDREIKNKPEFFHIGDEGSPIILPAAYAACSAHCSKSSATARYSGSARSSCSFARWTAQLSAYTIASEWSKS